MGPVGSGIDITGKAIVKVVEVRHLQTHLVDNVHIAAELNSQEGRTEVIDEEELYLGSSFTFLWDKDTVHGRVLSLSLVDGPSGEVLSEVKIDVRRPWCDYKWVDFMSDDLASPAKKLATASLECEVCDASPSEVRQFLMATEGVLQDHAQRQTVPLLAGQEAALKILQEDSDVEHEPYPSPAPQTSTVLTSVKHNPLPYRHNDASGVSDSPAAKGGIHSPNASLPLHISHLSQPNGSGTGSERPTPRSESGYSSPGLHTARSTNLHSSTGLVSSTQPSHRCVSTPRSQASTCTPSPRSSPNERSVHLRDQLNDVVAGLRHVHSTLPTNETKLRRQIELLMAKAGAPLESIPSTSPAMPAGILPLSRPASPRVKAKKRVTETRTTTTSGRSRRSTDTSSAAGNPRTVRGSSRSSATRCASMRRMASPYGTSLGPATGRPLIPLREVGFPSPAQNHSTSRRARSPVPLIAAQKFGAHQSPSILRYYQADVDPGLSLHSVQSAPAGRRTGYSHITKNPASPLTARALNTNPSQSVSPKPLIATDHNVVGVPTLVKRLGRRVSSVDPRDSLSSIRTAPTGNRACAMRSISPYKRSSDRGGVRGFRPVSPSVSPVPPSVARSISAHRKDAIPDVETQPPSGREEPVAVMSSRRRSVGKNDPMTHVSPTTRVVQTRFPINRQSQQRPQPQERDDILTALIANKTNSFCCADSELSFEDLEMLVKGP